MKKMIDFASYEKKADENSYLYFDKIICENYENGAVASFNMSAFNAGGRYIRIMGTDGEIYGDMDKSTIDYFDFKTRKHDITTLENIVASGHHGGDAGIVKTL